MGAFSWSCRPPWPPFGHGPSPWPNRRPWREAKRRYAVPLPATSTPSAPQAQGVSGRPGPLPGFRKAVSRMTEEALRALLRRSTGWSQPCVAARHPGRMRGPAPSIALHARPTMCRSPRRRRMCSPYPSTVSHGHPRVQRKRRLSYSHNRTRPERWGRRRPHAVRIQPQGRKRVRGPLRAVKGMPHRANPLRKGRRLERPGGMEAGKGPPGSRKAAGQGMEPPGNR